MAIFPTAAHLVSWAKISPRANQSGAKTRSGKTGKGNPYLKGVLGEAAASAGCTNTFLGARYRRLARRMGKLKALVPIARSNLTSRYRDIGPEFFNNRIRPERRKMNHIRQLEALGYNVTLTPGNLTTSTGVTSSSDQATGPDSPTATALRRSGAIAVEPVPREDPGLRVGSHV
jgi:transposase